MAITPQQRRMILRDAESLANKKTHRLGDTLREDTFLPPWLANPFADYFSDIYEAGGFDSREHRILCLLLLLEMDGE